MVRIISPRGLQKCKWLQCIRAVIFFQDEPNTVHISLSLYRHMDYVTVYSYTDKTM